jgi:hypothetical protein
MSSIPGSDRNWNANQQHGRSWGQVYYIGDPHMICPSITLTFIDRPFPAFAWLILGGSQSRRSGGPIQMAHRSQVSIHH